MLYEEWDMETALAVEREEGREEGREKGLEIGREEGRAETIKNLLENGIAAEQIAIALKLPVETVKQYLSKPESSDF